MSILSNIKNNIDFSIEVKMFRLGRFGILRNAEKVTRTLSLKKGILSFGEYSFYILYSENQTPEQILKTWGVYE